MTTSCHKTPVRHHVALFHRGDLVAPLARELEGDAGDPLDLVGIVDLGVDRALLAVAEVENCLRLAKIDPAGQLAHDHDVEPVDQLALEAGGVGEHRIADRRPKIGEQTQILAQPQERRLGAHLIGQHVHFGPPTAPNSTASAACAFAIVSSVTATPCAS